MVRCYCLKLVVSGHKVNMFKLIFAMRIVDLVKFSRSILETLSDFDIKTSDVRFMDTLAHELYHVHSAICEYYDVPTDGEDAAWTMGFLMRQAVNMITSKYMPTATPRAWA